MNDKEWSEWTDMLGNTYGPGDYGVYAKKGYSDAPILMFARVIRINRVNSKGEPIRDGNGKPSCTLTLEAIESSTGYSVDRKKTTLQEPRRFVRVENNYIEKFAAIKEELHPTPTPEEAFTALHATLEELEGV